MEGKNRSSWCLNLFVFSASLLKDIYIGCNNVLEKDLYFGFNSLVGLFLLFCSLFLRERKNEI